MNRWFQRVVLGRVWLSFLVMALAFFAFGLGTVNLFFLMRANAELLYEHGWQALMDGGAQQLAELLASGLAAMLAYVVFKTCEQRLVQWLGRND